jgi:hypothetical protein
MNADGLLGPSKVLVACNPYHSTLKLRLPLDAEWKPVVVSPQSQCPHAPGVMPQIEQGVLTLGPLACGVWFVKT